MTNSITFYVYKSARKNAKWDSFDILHYTPSNTQRDIEKIASATAKLLCVLKDFGTTKIRMGATIHQQTCSEYQNADGSMYSENKWQSIATGTYDLYSIEQAINFMYQCYAVANPQTNLSMRTLHEHPSIRYYINRYYHPKEK